MKQQDQREKEEETAARRITVRLLVSSDAEAAALLSSQLGYSCDVAEMRNRIERLAGSDERIAFTAVMDQNLVGWADAAIERHLQSADAVVLGGLVVREDVRGEGIGRRLCQSVEDWAQSRGVTVVRIRSQIKREAAHRFYLRSGYEQVKISSVFEKKLRS